MIAQNIISKLPNHLKTFIIDQEYHRYTPQDHAVWRAVMRQNTNYLKNVAHKSYIDGLKKTGISIEKIPSTLDMNKALETLGWAAVTVDGFIPPAAFMEFQKHNVLVIAADIRSANQIQYTPAPDIIHEAAGHAPIIADPEYAEYLRYFGEIGSKAFSSKSDYEIYEAIRHLSILKADPYSTQNDIDKAEELLNITIEKTEGQSEMALIRNLHWWTVEYGLIGTVEKPYIYGAGLLSSIGESKTALANNVIKLPYNIDAKDYSFDITAPQPQLFVTPDFAHLSNVLEEFANLMALRHGGIEGIMKAIESEESATVEYSSGLQVSGSFSDVILNKGIPVYIMTKGPTTLNYNNRLLPGEGTDIHSHGFGSPIGKIKGILKPTRFLQDDDLKELGFDIGREVSFAFESGVKVKGTLVKTTRRDDKLLIISFNNCVVKYRNRVLFEPSWGQYDMAIGETITSAFNGPADPDSYGVKFDPPAEKTHKIVYNNQMKQLFELYDEVRIIRESGQNLNNLSKIWNSISESHINDWLLATEIYELTKDDSLKKEIKEFLTDKKRSHPESSIVIDNVLSISK